MHERALRTILLIQAVEESDTQGELLPLAERAEAMQSIARGDVDVHDAFAGDALSRAGERLLARRAAHLHERLRLRAPVTDKLLAVAGGSSGPHGMLTFALIAGVVLAVLDGRGYIDVLGLALLGLIAWNLVVYGLLIANWVRPRAFSGAGIARLYARWMASRADAVLRRSRSFNAPLAAALPRFAKDWGALSQALIMQRAKRLLHLCAALVAVGCIAGLLVRGEVLRDHAAWSSSFFGAAIVRVFLHLLYGPAALISGIALPPSAQDVEAMRLGGASGGVAALPWIYLIALTTTLYIIVPRALAALTASLHLWQIGRRMPLPESVVPYARRTLSATAAAPVGNSLEPKPTSGDV
jgi:hypothetical protein